MTMTDVFQKITSGELAGWAFTVLILLLSLIQISPLKLNPWDRIFGWIGKKTQGELHKQVADLQKQITDIWISSTDRAFSPLRGNAVPIFTMMLRNGTIFLRLPMNMRSTVRRTL